MTPRSGPGGPNSGPRGPKTTPRAPQEATWSDSTDAKKQSKMSFGSRLAPGSPPGAILEPFPSLRGAFFEQFGNAFWLAFSTPPALHFGTSAATSFRHVCFLCFSSLYCAPRTNQAATKQRQRQYANKGHAIPQRNPSTHGAQACASDGLQA